ncbi:MAG: acyl carrier protein [Sphingobacteriales bacterium]|jgi:acyl carrier protein|nr:acyl carrier protein [Sphingobacteriales bacterium]
MNEIISITNSFLVDEFEADADAIKPKADLKVVLDLDSLDYIDLVVALENNFHFKVQPGDFAPLVTFQDFYNYIESQIARKETV